MSEPTKAQRVALEAARDGNLLMHYPIGPYPAQPRIGYRNLNRKTFQALRVNGWVTVPPKAIGHWGVAKVVITDAGREALS